MGQFESFSLLRLVADLIAGDVAAAITGLEPVTGALVELIRIDNAGNQVGAVLATATTSVTGDYTLQLPAGVDLAGNLIVRITGSGDNDLRAQVVEQSVDISPVSEFILRKFIATDVDLAALEASAVVRLSGKAQEFDLTAGSDLTALFDQLEASMGDFVDSQLDAIQSAPTSATALSGDYRSAAMQVALGDSDGNGFGFFAIDLWFSTFTVTGTADGTVAVAHTSEESASGYVHGSDTAVTQLDYGVRMEDKSDILDASFNDAHVMAVEGQFEEEIEGDYGWRWPPTIYRFQKVTDQNLFFLLSQEAAVRYTSVDTDDDTIKDALDPNAREGDEVVRGMEVFFKKPTAMTSDALSGTFGRVYFGVQMQASGHILMEMETNELVFAGSQFDYGAGLRNSISRNSVGVVNAQTETTAAEEDLTISIGTDGDILSVADEPADGFVNDAANLVVFAESDGEDGTSANFSQAFLVKLPTSTPSVANKRYRLMFLDTSFAGTGFAVNNSRIHSFITWTSNSVGTMALQAGTISKAALAANIVPVVHAAAERAVSAEIAANGAATMNIADTGGTLRFKGYWNETASYGLFTVGYLPNGETALKSIGLAVLAEITE